MKAFDAIKLKIPSNAIHNANLPCMLEDSSKHIHNQNEQGG